MEAEPAMRRSHPLPWPFIIAIALFLWIAGVVTLAQWHMAPTFDEQNHVTRGIAVLRTGDYRLCFHHPPLANILEALPVAWRAGTWFSTDMPAWTSLNIWDASHEVMWVRSADGVGMIHLARLPVLIFTLGLALLIFLWSRELFGPWGGVLSLTLFALDPTVLAHSGLATTDAAAACTIALAVYLLRGYLKSPTRGRLAVTGLGFGLALVAKFSALILAPITGVILLIVVAKPALAGDGIAARWLLAPVGERVTRALSICLLLAVLSGATVWAVYGFKVEALGSKPGQPVAADASWKKHLPVPAKQYFRGLATVKKEAAGHRAYLLGKTDATGKGWWYYFPVAIATKTPLPELLLILGALVLLAVPRWREKMVLPRGELLYLLLPAAIYLASALGILGISLNLGIRHILPVYPFLLVLSGGWAVLAARYRAVMVTLAVLVLVQFISVARAYPDFLSYFNEAAGGSENGYHILVDSNYDWGQDLERLAQLQRTQSLTPLTFSYFGTTDPHVYGLQYTPSAGFGLMREVPPVDPRTAHGYFAISVTELMGGADYNAAGVDYRMLLDHQPYARAGKTIFVYALP